MSKSLLDPGQIAQESFSDADKAIKVISIGGSLVPDAYDEADYTYNGTGQVATAVYKLAGATIASLTFTYNASNQLTQVIKT